MEATIKDGLIKLPQEAIKKAHLPLKGKCEIEVNQNEILIKNKNASALEILNKAFGSWKPMKKTSLAYVNDMRKESDKRLRRLEIV